MKKFFISLVASIFSLFAILLFVGATRVDVKAHYYYKWAKYKKSLNPQTIPAGTSNLEIGYEGGLYFIYKGDLPTPDANGLLHIKNNCEENSQSKITPHYYTVCLPEYGITPDEIFSYEEIKPLFPGIYFISAGVANHFYTTYER